MSTLVDQLLFGYRDGHELLESSASIEPRLLSKLLPHTDARFEDDAQHYLVGTPVPDLKRFLLARVWPAPELPRPGAVWAHALLLRSEALNVVDPVALVSRFRRPDISERAFLNGYGHPLEVQPSPFRPVEAPDQLILSLCWAVYGSDKRGTVVVWDGDAEAALLALWRRQPRAARSKFSFRTRGRARTGESPYALQVASMLGGRSGSDVVSVLDARRLAIDDVPPWVRLLGDATLDPSSTFGAFLDEFAVTQRSMATLAQLWPLLGDESDPRAVADFLTRRYPKPTSMKRLKVALFGSGATSRAYWRIAEEDRVITALQADSGAFDYTTLHLAERVDALWNGDARGSLLGLVDARDRLAPEAAALVLATGARRLAPAEIAQRGLDRPLISAVAQSRADLFASPDLWESVRPPADEEVLAHAVTAIPHRRLVQALVMADALPLLRSSAGHGVDPLVIADGLARNAPDDLFSWAEVFAGYERDLGLAIVTASRVRADTMLLAAAFLSPAQGDMVALKRWIPAARLAHDRRDTAATIAAGRLLAKALSATGETARALLIETFGPVHLALEQESLEAETWQALDSLLPDPSSDPAKRLRRALLRSMDESEWKPDELARALEPAGPEAKRLVKLVGKKHPLRRLVENAVEEIFSPLRS